MQQGTIIIVSGLPRSGTSMMMQMLVAGGMPALTDNIRGADEDNPEGYLEFERVKQIEHDQAWLKDAQGKAVKMIAALLKHLPATHSYRIIFMRRDIREVLASQRQMLIRRGEPTDVVSDERMAELFRRHVDAVEAWLTEQSNFDVLYVDYGSVLSDPLEQAKLVNEFLGDMLNADEMAAAVDPELYRQRR
jgi:hypothetical protein